MAAIAPRAQDPLFAVCYDVSDHRERRRLASLLQSFGFRVQKSVFECRLGKAQRLQLVSALERLNLKTGQVRTYQVLSNSPVRKVGRILEEPDAVFAFCV